ncbi:MAG: Rrf2 family transcriptional regulator [Betaproteobacteria bacterium]|jgi:Rrf2 family protein|nr:Rrf2 family transcriptional regulator [Betaproteobacteria bacterium]
MILSRTSQYAIQALIFIATQPRGVPVLIRTVAEHLGVPSPYLAKIMQDLGRGKIIHSFRGRQGGVCLREGGDKIDLMQILTLIEGPGLTENCVLGLKVCGDETACPVHTQWKPIKTKIVKLLNQQTLSKLAAAVRSGKYRLTELPLSLMESAGTLPGSSRAVTTRPAGIRPRRAVRTGHKTSTKAGNDSSGGKRSES